jgi:hypothetical protein
VRHQIRPDVFAPPPLRKHLPTNGAGPSNIRTFAMPDKVHKVEVQIKAPRGSDPGHVEEAWYVVFENNVILTDQDGKPSRAFRSNM